jgi:hypothetical protein
MLNELLSKEIEEDWYLKFEEANMFTKEELSTRHVVKLRDSRVCFIGEQMGLDGVVSLKLYNSKSFGAWLATSKLSEYDNDLLTDDEGYDIMAITEFRSTSEAIGSAITSVTEWDWEREEKSKQQIEKEEIMKEMSKLEERLSKLEVN